MPLPTAEYEIPQWLIAATARPARPADVEPSPVDEAEVEAIRASDPRVTRELPAVA